MALTLTFCERSEHRRKEKENAARRAKAPRRRERSFLRRGVATERERDAFFEKQKNVVANKCSPQKPLTFYALQARHRRAKRNASHAKRTKFSAWGRSVCESKGGARKRATTFFCFSNKKIVGAKRTLLRRGDPDENRTRDTAVKGRCLNLLTTGPLVAAIGFEPMTLRV